MKLLERGDDRKPLEQLGMTVTTVLHTGKYQSIRDFHPRKRRWARQNLPGNMRTAHALRLDINTKSEHVIGYQVLEVHRASSSTLVERTDLEAVKK